VYRLEYLKMVISVTENERETMYHIIKKKQIIRIIKTQVCQSFVKNDRMVKKIVR